MLAYLPLIQQILLEFLTKRSARHGFIFNFTGMGLMALSVVLGFLVLIFLLLAFQTYTASIYGELQSWLLTAGLTFLLACMTFLLAHVSRKKKGLVHQVKEEVEDRLTPVSQLIETLAEPVKDHPLAAVLLAGLAGIMAGEKLKGDGTGE